jgi:glycosyl transferase family 11
MITTVLMGGMGNQMFQYACGLAQARRLNTSVWFDVSLLGGKRKFVLNQWSLPKDIFTVTGVQPTIHENGMGHNRDINEKVKDGDCLYGYWQSKKYFEHIQDDVRRIFIPVQPAPDGAFSVKLRMISNTVAVHVRRDDYLIAPHKEFHGLLPMSYYESAMQHIRSRVTNPTFFIFSEDVEWTRQNFTSPDVVIMPRGQEAEDIYNMSLCHHAITANSSFSWWGAFLGDARSEDRIVIAPSQWFQDQRTDYSDIVPDRWLRQ